MINPMKMLKIVFNFLTFPIRLLLAIILIAGTLFLGLIAMMFGFNETRIRKSIVLDIIGTTLHHLLTGIPHQKKDNKNDT